MSPVSVTDLADRIAAGETVHLLDVRWQLGDTRGREHHLAGHLPGAVFVSLDTELAGPASASQGRHPLPSLADLQRSARAWGLRAGEPVVLYDATGGLAAARAWWLLRWAGVVDVDLLDGGLAAWTAAGLPLEEGPVQPVPGDITLTGGQLAVLDADGAAVRAAADDTVLLDARAAERYRGEVEPIDPRAGHIPGAVSAPTVENLSADGRFLTPDQLRARFAAVGVDGGVPVGVYCGSGVTAAHTVYALSLVGVDAALYPGSWSQWSSDPQRPGATA